MLTKWIGGTAAELENGAGCDSTKASCGGEHLEAMPKGERAVRDAGRRVSYSPYARTLGREQAVRAPRQLDKIIQSGGQCMSCNWKAQHNDSAVLRNGGEHVLEYDDSVTQAGTANAPAVNAV